MQYRMAVVGTEPTTAHHQFACCLGCMLGAQFAWAVCPAGTAARQIKVERGHHGRRAVQRGMASIAFHVACMVLHGHRLLGLLTSLSLRVGDALCSIPRTALRCSDRGQVMGKVIGSCYAVDANAERSVSKTASHHTHTHHQSRLYLQEPISNDSCGNSIGDP